MSELIILFNCERNYSFAINFVRLLHSQRMLDSKYEILIISDVDLTTTTTTTTTNNDNDKQKQLIQENIRQLIIDYGVRIWTDIDIRNLHKHSRLISDIKLAINLKRIHLIYNFAAKINCNQSTTIMTTKMMINYRTLLRDMFMSIEDLHRECLIEILLYITISDGLSGLTPIEINNSSTTLSWHESLQLNEMASYGNFILIDYCYPLTMKTMKKLFCDNYERLKFRYQTNRKFHYYNNNSKNLNIIINKNKNNDCSIVVAQQQKPNQFVTMNKDNHYHRINEQMNLLNIQLEQYDPFGYCNRKKSLKLLSTKKLSLSSSSSSSLSTGESSTSSSSSSSSSTMIDKKIFNDCCFGNNVNLFVFEYRDYKLDCFIPRVIYTHPLSSNSLVQKFINDIGELMLDNIAGCRSVKPYLIERSSLLAIDDNHHNDNNDDDDDDSFCYSSNEPLDIYILSISLMDSTPQIQFRMMSTIIGRYLRKSYVDDLITEDLRIDDIIFGFWSKHNTTQRLLSLNLLVENCLRIKWNLNDTRILYSKYFHLIDINDHQKNPQQQQQQQHLILPTTGLLYPQIFYRNLTICWQFSSHNNNGKTKTHLPQLEFLRIVWDHFQPTNLHSIHLIKKIQLFDGIYYCYRFIIQSVDLAMDRQKIDDLITALCIRLKNQFSQIKIHHLQN
uniref:Uncharacterized protein LOC113793789 n=1 Tax=Dermatophagoides pteronyssinus TaxID=6956 RepID=A0A6P6Y2D8_DERPT|nr:uncharacterized protein LOC113793789 [Dermatophagoides pteronyssinus]